MATEEKKKVELTPCAEVRFVCRSAPSLKVKLSSSGKKLQFKNAVLLLNTEEEVAEMREGIKTRVHMKQLIRELDINAANEAARQHRELLESQRGTSVGGVTGETMHKAMQPTLDDRDNALAAQGINVDEFAQKAAENDGLVMTTKEPMPDRETELAAAAAFKAGQSTEVAKEANTATPSQIIGNLGNK